MFKAMLTLIFVLSLLSLSTGFAAEAQFKRTPGGAMYQQMIAGSGDVVRGGDVVTINYSGWISANGKRGKKFIDSRTDGSPLSFVVGTPRVMQGWNEAVIGMRVGGKRLVKLDPSLAYGARGVANVVPPNSKVIFSIELLGLRKR